MGGMGGLGVKLGRRHGTVHWQGSTGMGAHAPPLQVEVAAPRFRPTGRAFTWPLAIPRLEQRRAGTRGPASQPGGNLKCRRFHVSLRRVMPSNLCTFQKKCASPLTTPALLHVPHEKKQTGYRLPTELEADSAAVQRGNMPSEVHAPSATCRGRRSQSSRDRLTDTCNV